MGKRARQNLALFNALFLILATLGVYTAGAAVAAVTGTTFEIDGDTGGTNDWLGTNAAAYHVVSKNDACGKGEDDIIVPGTKLDDAAWPVQQGQSLNKGDLCPVYMGYEEVGGEIIFLFGWERFSNQGEMNVYVPLQDAVLPGRTGDLMFRFFYTSRASDMQVDLMTWNGSAWVEGVSVAFDGAVSADTLFAEVAVNLMEANILPRSATQCAQVVTGDVVTETGQQGGADPTLKDYVDLPPLSLNSCATVTVIKDTNPDGYNGPFTFDLVGENYSQTDQSLAGDGSSVSYSDVIPGEYTLTEDDPAALGFALESIVCDDVDVTEGMFAVAANGNHVCVITNAALPGSLTLIKTVNNAYGSTATEADFVPSIGETEVAWNVPVELAVGSYTASEEMLVPGYTASDWGGDCAADGSVNIGPGEDKTCTITNSDAPLSVQLDKSADPASRPEPGGIFEFTLTVTNTSNEPVTITDLDDTRAEESSDYGLSCDALVGVVLAAGGSTSCTYHATYTDAGVYPNAATVEVTDDDGRKATDHANATVTVDDLESTLTVTKTAGVESLPEPGGDVTYTVTITNDSTVDDLTIDSIEDDQFGTLTGDTDCQVGTVLAPGATCSFQFIGAVTGDPGYSHTNVVTVYGTDEDGLVLFDTDDATVVITDLPSSIMVDKFPSVPTVNEPGGNVTFIVTVTNTSEVDTVTIESLVDSVFGDLDGVGTCAVPQVLDPGEIYQCSFTEFIAGDAGFVHENLVTASGVDDDGAAVEDDDDATVTVVDVLPTVEVVKDAGVDTLNEPGGDVTYTVTVTNTSVEDVILVSLDDDQFGDVFGLSGECGALEGVTLTPGESVSCSFTATITGDAGDVHTNVVTATVVDNEQNQASDKDDAEVGFLDVLPVITVDKVATPTALDEPGGMVDYQVTVTNQSVEDVLLVMLDDDKFGDVFGLSEDCAGLSDVTLAPGESVSCLFDELILGNAGDVHTNVVTATAIDNEENQTTATDDATVVIGDLPASIDITKTPGVGSVDENGGDVTFTLVVTNTSAVDTVVITSLVDDVYGDLLDADNPDVSANTCVELAGYELGAGDSVECSFVGFVSGNAGDVHYNVATVIGVDDDQGEVTDDDDAQVTIGDVGSSIDVTKTPSVGSVTEPGGNVVFTVEVTNTSPTDTVYITSLVDDVYGDLDGAGTCEVGEGIELVPGESYTCEFVGEVAGDPGDIHVNTVTADGFDDDDNPVSDSDDAEVLVVDVPSSIEVTKTASVTSVLEPSGTVTVTVTVTNTSTVDTVVITGMVDDIYGDLDGVGTCAAPQTLAPGETYTCQFMVEVSGDAGTVHHNTVDVDGTDDDDNPVFDSDDETVQILDNPGRVSGLVWFDADDDGIQDAGEPGIANVVVLLMPVTGGEITGLASAVAQTTTDSTGHYVFDGVDAGDYLIRVVGPVGFTGWAKTDQGSDDAVDSDVTFVTGSDVSTKTGVAETAKFSLAPGGSVVRDGGLVVEVLGIVVTTTTTIAAVTASTLPFTGFETGRVVTIGLIALALGGLMLMAAGRREEEMEPETIKGSWKR